MARFGNLLFLSSLSAGEMHDRGRLWRKTGVAGNSGWSRGGLA